MSAATLYYVYMYKRWFEYFGIDKNKYDKCVCVCVFFVRFIYTESYYGVLCIVMLVTILYNINCKNNHEWYQ